MALSDIRRFRRLQFGMMAKVHGARRDDGAQ
jgi:hypothetical protein